MVSNFEEQVTEMACDWSGDWSCDRDGLGGWSRDGKA